MKSHHAPLLDGDESGEKRMMGNWNRYLYVYVSCGFERKSFFESHVTHTNKNIHIKGTMCNYGHNKSNHILDKLHGWRKKFKEKSV